MDTVEIPRQLADMLAGYLWGKGSDAMHLYNTLVVAANASRPPPVEETKEPQP